MEQGWVEGALKSAELILARIGVPEPVKTVPFPSSVAEYIRR